MKRPAYYAAPLRSRKDMAEWLAAHQNYYRHRSGNSPLAWNVKAHSVDFDFDHLIEVWRAGGEYSLDDRWLDYPEFLVPARAKYEEMKDRLWEWAVEGAQENVLDYEGYRSLWKGTSLDVKYEFAGRSGGWLLMTEFEGYRVKDYDPEDFKSDLMDPDVFPFQKLRNLYELVVQNDHDFRREAVREQLEFRAAWDLIENLCADIPKPDRTQAVLF